MNKLLFLVVFYLNCFICSAQTIINYTTVDGLIDNFVECIDVDIDDNIWFGTSMGLQMYDGTNWYLWDQSSFPSLLSNNIKTIKTASNGEIWVGSDYGLNRLLYGVPGSVWLSYTTADGLVNNQIKSIDEDDSGNIWVGTSQGVSVFDGNSWTSYASPDLHWSGVSSTAFDSNGDKWFASPLGGITHFDGINFTVYDTSNGLLSQNVTDLVIDHQNNKWIGTGGGISVLDPSNTSFIHYTQMYSLSPPDTLNPVVDLEIDYYGRLWSAIYVGYLAKGGIAMLSTNQWSNFDVTDGVIGQNIRAISIDSENSVWIATSTGVSKILSSPNLLPNSLKNNFSFFPNPTKNQLSVVDNDSEIQEIFIHNSIGSLVYVDVNFSKYDVIDISLFKQGLYYITFRCGDLNFTKKLVISQ
tara:strand:+ start:1502 stop:2737 length:1236 start_codon:yes stop_codon:yes gene_type:complete